MNSRKENNNTKIRFWIVLPILTIVIIGVVSVLSLFYEKSWSYNWNGVRDNIKDSVKVAEYGGISSGWVGIAPKKPKQYDRRHWIMKNATVSELLKLTNYPNGTIKTIAYEGLIRKPDFDKKTDLIIKAMNDTEFPIEFQSGCVGTPMYISEYLVDFVLHIDDKSPPPPIGERNRYGFTENELERILTEYRKTPSLWK